MPLNTNQTSCYIILHDEENFKNGAKKRLALQSNESKFSLTRKSISAKLKSGYNFPVQKWRINPM